jgi:ATP-binding protein involved in chromosome partitioning
MPLPMYKDDDSQEPMMDVGICLAIAAGKGGVGKSSLTVNLAQALHRKGYRVGIMDVDVYGPSMRRMLPEDRLPSQKGDLYYPALSRGISMISMAYFRKEHEASAVRAPIANGIVLQFVQKVVWGKLDYLLIDFPPGTGDIQLSVCQQIPITAGIMITTPQEVAMMDVRKAINFFDQLNVPILGIVENMSYYDHPCCGERVHLFGKDGGKRLAQEAGLPFLGEIPIDPKICQSGDEGTSLFENAETLTAASAFTRLTEEVNKHLKLLEHGSPEGLGQFELIWQEK